MIGGMPRQKHNPRVYELAKVGAESQMRDLLREVQQLLELFPHLRDSFDKDELPISFIMAKDSGRVTRRNGKRKPMSAAGRRAVSERMKKYWAAKRKASA